VVKVFGAVRAVDGVSFNVRRGTITGLLGRNGAGKTTTIRMITGIFMPDSGSIEWLGETAGAGGSFRDRVGYLPEERGLYKQMKLVEQLIFLAEIKGRRPADVRPVIDRWLERFELTEKRDAKVEELSKGNQQKVQLIAAILHEPAVLLMDEPFVGLDPVNVALLKEAFGEMRERGSTLIFSTHQMEMVEELCEAVALIDRGRVVLAGPIRDVKRSTGRRVVHLALDGRSMEDAGSIPWLEAIPGVRVARAGQDYAELDVPRDIDPEVVLRTALEKGERVTNFLIADPSIEEIFIEKVGRAPTSADEKHLAAADAGSAPAASAGVVS
jgi:ABC-2 type transport system ATP-binding protein